MPTNKPNLNRIWAAGADPGNIIDPDVGESGKFDAGWLSELPPFEYFNFMYQLFTKGLAHMNEQGISVWDTDTVYPIKAWARGSNGEVYQAKSQHSGKDPVSNPNYWDPLSSIFKSKEIHRTIITTSGTWDIPIGVSKVLVSISGAGGGGAGGDDGNTSGVGANGTDASNTTVSYNSISATAYGGKRGQGVGLTSSPSVPSPQKVGGVVTGDPLSSSILISNGGVGGVGGVGQTLDSSGGNQGGTGGTGGTGGKVEMEIATSGNSLSISIGNPGTGGIGNSSNSNNDGISGSPSYVELTWLQ